MMVCVHVSSKRCSESTRLIGCSKYTHTHKNTLAVKRVFAWIRIVCAINQYLKIFLASLWCLIGQALALQFIIINRIQQDPLLQHWCDHLLTTLHPALARPHRQLYVCAWLAWQSWICPNDNRDAACGPCARARTTPRLAVKCVHHAVCATSHFPAQIPVRLMCTSIIFRKGRRDGSTVSWVYYTYIYTLHKLHNYLAAQWKRRVGVMCVALKSTSLPPNGLKSIWRALPRYAWVQHKKKAQLHQRNQGTYTQCAIYPS